MECFSRKSMKEVMVKERRKVGDEWAMTRVA